MNVLGEQDFEYYLDELSSFPPFENLADRYLAIFSWLTRLSSACGLESPILVGGGAVEIYTESGTSCGDLDVISPDVPELTSILLQLGFQRSSDQEYIYHSGLSILFEFPASEPEHYQESVAISHDGTRCKLISPEDLIVARLEAFEAAGGGVELVTAYLLFAEYFDRLDHVRLKQNVLRLDVRESFRFITKLQEESRTACLGAEEQGKRLAAECRRRMGIE